MYLDIISSPTQPMVLMMWSATNDMHFCHQLSSLAQWPQGKDDALADIVRELYALYRHFQVAIDSRD